MEFTFNSTDNQPESTTRQNEKYSLDQLLETVMSYDAQFGESVPLDLLAKAAITFRSTELMTSLNDQIQSNQSIEDWSLFTAEFFVRE